MQWWCGRRDLNPQAFWAPAPKAGVFAISPLPHGAAQASLAYLKSRVKLPHVAMCCNANTAHAYNAASSANPASSAFCAPRKSPALAAGFRFEANVANDDGFVECLGHVVDGERGNGGSGEGFHFDAGGAGCGCAST